MDIAVVFIVVLISLTVCYCNELKYLSSFYIEWTTAVGIIECH